MVSTHSRMALGTMLEATEITPQPPTAIRGMVMASSPESTCRLPSTFWHSYWIWMMLPEASFTAKTTLPSARRAMVSGRALEAVRPGTL